MENNNFEDKTKEDIYQMKIMVFNISLSILK